MKSQSSLLRFSPKRSTIDSSPVTDKMLSEGLQTGVSRYDLTLPMATEWTEVGQLEKIFVYPLKSAKGRVVSSAQVSTDVLSL